MKVNLGKGYVAFGSVGGGEAVGRGSARAAGRDIAKGPRRVLVAPQRSTGVPPVLRVTLRDRSLSLRGPQTNRLVGKIMVGFDHSHRPAPGTHQDGVSDRSMSSNAYPTQKR
jgi:hypothetical protein